MSDYPYPEPCRNVSAPQLELDRDVTKRGWMYKKSGRSKIQFSPLSNYDRRYFIMLKGWVYYYKDENSKSPQNSFSLKGYSSRVIPAEEERNSSLPYVFKVFPKSADGRTYYFAPESQAEMIAWRECFKQEIEKYNITANNLRMSRSLPEKRIGGDSPSSPTDFRKVHSDTKRPNSFSNGSHGTTLRSMVGGNSIASSHSTSTNASLSSLPNDDIDPTRQDYFEQGEYEKFDTPADIHSPQHHWPTAQLPTDNYEDISTPFNSMRPPPIHKKPVDRTSSIPTDQPPEPPVGNSHNKPRKLDLPIERMVLSPRFHGGPLTPSRTTPVVETRPEVPSRIQGRASLSEQSMYEEPNAVFQPQAIGPPPPVAKTNPSQENREFASRTKPLPAVPQEMRSVAPPHGGWTLNVSPQGGHNQPDENDNYQDTAEDFPTPATKIPSPKPSSGFTTPSRPGGGFSSPSRPMIGRKLINRPLPPTKTEAPAVSPKPAQPPSKPRALTAKPEIATAPSTVDYKKKLSPPNGAKTPVVSSYKPGSPPKPVVKHGTESAPKTASQAKPLLPNKPRAQSKPVTYSGETSSGNSVSSGVAAKAKMFGGRGVGNEAAKNSNNENVSSVTARARAFESSKPPTGQKPAMKFNYKR